MPLFQLFLHAVTCAIADDSMAFHDDFDSLKNWRPFAFEKVEKHTSYTTGVLPDGGMGLKAETRQSASGLICTRSFNPFETPVLSWRWRVENVFKNGDATRKDGDDYPLRVYVLFHYDPQKSGAAQKLKYLLARKIHGEYPPDSVLNYIWASRKHSERILSSPYTDRSRMIIMRAGAEDIGRWLDEKVNLLDDYRTAFAGEPPARATLAIMSDSDNTGEAAVAYLDYITLLPDEKPSSVVDGPAEGRK